MTVNGQKIDRLCYDHLDDCKTVWDVISSYKDIFDLLNFAFRHEILSSKEDFEIYGRYKLFTKLKIISILDETVMEEGGAKDCQE